MVLAPEKDEKIDVPGIFRYGDLWYMIFITFDGKGYETDPLYFGCGWKRSGAFDTFACSYDPKYWIKWEGKPCRSPRARRGGRTALGSRRTVPQMYSRDILRERQGCVALSWKLLPLWKCCQFQCCQFQLVIGIGFWQHFHIGNIHSLRPREGVIHNLLGIAVIAFQSPRRRTDIRHVDGRSENAKMGKRRAWQNLHGVGCDNICRHVANWNIAAVLG